MKRFVTFSIGFFLVLVFSGNILAEKVGPPRIYITVHKGKAETAILSLQGVVLNEKVFLYLCDITVDRKGNYSFENLKGWKYSALDWVKLYKLSVAEEKVIEDPNHPIIITSPAQEEARLPKKRVVAYFPYEEKDVLSLRKEAITYMGIKVQVPFDVKPGQYYAGIMSEPVDFQTLRGIVDGKAIQVQKKTRIAIPVIITVPGGVVKKTGKIATDPETSLPVLHADVQQKEIRISATFENTGNIIEYAKGEARIVGKIDGRTYAVVPMKALNPSSVDGAGEIFPETLRDFEGIVSRPLPAGDYKVKLAINYGVKFREARAEAEITVSEAVAQSQKDLLMLAVEPAFLNLRIKPGQTTMESIELTNLDYQPLSIKAAIVPEGLSWLQINRSDKIEVDLLANQMKKIVCRISVPRDEKTGEAQVKRAKIILVPERGKTVSIDVEIVPGSGTKGD
ncbi:MAG: hypothetical protein PHW01_02300 [Patescibacteria group bacterium]|nr:hypothetical protein [Patescibacteria group bacterium]